MDFKRSKLFYLALILFLAACSRAATPTITLSPLPPTTSPTASIEATFTLPAATSATSSPELVNPQTPAVQAEPGSMVGILISKESGQPMADAVVRLAEVTRQGDQGMFVLDAGRSPAARTDATGAFKIEDVSPAEYVMLLQISEGIYSTAKDDNGKPLTWVVEAGRVVDTGPVAIKTNIP